MGTKKISELTETTSLIDNDLIPVVDVTNNATKKIKFTKLKENIVGQDTGWVDMSSYLNSSYCSIRQDFTPEVRRIGNEVFWRGEIYCSTAPNNNNLTLLNSIPEQFRSQAQHTSSGATYTPTNLYFMWIEDGNVRVKMSNNIEVQQSYGGFDLCNLSGYLTD